MLEIAQKSWKWPKNSNIYIYSTAGGIYSRTQLTWTLMGDTKFVRLDERLSYPGWIQGNNDSRRTRNPSDLSRVRYIHQTLSILVKKKGNEVMTLMRS